MINTMKLSIARKNPVRPAMLLATVGFWIVLNQYFFDRYIQIIDAHVSWIGKITIGAIVLWIVLTSFYASFHLMSLFCSLAVKWLGKKAVRNYGEKPHVAIFYPCKNDMKEEAIEACLAQNYPHYALYVLDDSSASMERQQVDALKERYGKRITIIRRAEKRGYKAGNLNNALREVGSRYKHICVVDADELIPPTFLHEMVAIAEGNSHLGFIQASHRQYGETCYGKQTGNGIDLHWSYFMPARNWFGFVYTYGHGVLFRVQALLFVGGFPEIVAEDVALSTKLREAGYRGYYAYDIECLEEAPPSYEAFRRRNRKIVAGTLEFLFEFYPSFWRSAGVSLVEKLDLLITLFVIYMPVPFVVFLVILYGVLPLLSIGVAGTPHVQNTLQLFEPLQRWDAVVFLFFTVFSPLCYLLPNAIRSPKKVMAYVLKMGTIYLSVILHTVGSALKWFITQKTQFTPTGDRFHRKSVSITDYIEGSLGLMTILLGFLTGSISLIAIGVSLSLVPILVKRNFEGRLIPFFTMIPILITIVAFLGMPVLMVGVTGMFAGVALAHHW